MQRFNSEKEIAILRRNSSILIDEARTTKVNRHIEEQRKGEILEAVDEKSKQIDKKATVVQQGINISWHHTLSGIRINFFVSPIRIWMSSLSVSLIIQIENFGWFVTFLIQAKDFDQLGECNQDFVAPAPYQIPIEVVSFRAPALGENAFCSCILDRTERDVAGIVRRSERTKKFDGGRRPTKGRSRSKGEMIRQNIQESEWIMITERAISSIRKEKMIISCNSSNLSRRSPFRGGILQFWTTDREQTKSTFTQRNTETEKQRNREIWKAVDDKSKKFNKNRRVLQQGINISWHHIHSLIRITFYCVSNACFTVISERFSNPLDRKFGLTWDFLRVAESNQDFMAPAPCHMPIEVLSARVREHPHEERTPSGVVSWTERIDRNTAGKVKEWTRETEMKRWIDKTAKSLCKCWEMTVKSSRFYWKKVYSLQFS